MTRKRRELITWRVRSCRIRGCIRKVDGNQKPAAGADFERSRNFMGSRMPAAGADFLLSFCVSAQASLKKSLMLCHLTHAIASEHGAMEVIFWNTPERCV